MRGCSRWNSADGLRKTSNCYCLPGRAGGSPLDVSSVSNLASLYEEQGRHAEAEPLSKRALEVNERLLGKEHPSTLLSINNPPCHAVVLSIDEKSQIQALDRTQPGLPLKPGKCATMTHDYKRNGTTTLFAALNLLDGTVLGRCMQRHRHQEFIKFLNAVERKVPAGKIIHVILDNYGTRKHPKVKAWLADHPRWVLASLD